MLHGTVHGMVHSMVHGMRYGMVHGMVHSMVHGVMHGTMHSILLHIGSMSALYRLYIGEAVILSTGAHTRALDMPSASPR